MRGEGLCAVAWIAICSTSLVGQDTNRAQPPAAPYLTWSSAEAQQIGRSTRVSGRVAGGQRLLHTERAYSYKLRATWLTSDVIRAAARLAQLSDRLSDEQVGTLVAEAEAAGDTVIMIEIDPNEGSGVIPLDWVALLGPKESTAGGPGVVKGTSVPKLRDVRALSGVFRRDYDYDVFWVVFPLRIETGKALFPESAAEAELVVRIYGNEGRVKWMIPQSIRTRSGIGEQ